MSWTCLPIRWGAAAVFLGSCTTVHVRLCGGGPACAVVTPGFAAPQLYVVRLLARLWLGEGPARSPICSYTHFASIATPLAPESLPTAASASSTGLCRIMAPQCTTRYVVLAAIILSATLPPLQGPFDAIFFNAVFGNLFDQHVALTKACFLLRPGGYVVVSHPLGKAWLEQLR
jgi:hypothetical protein